VIATALIAAVAACVVPRAAHAAIVARPDLVVTAAAPRTSRAQVGASIVVTDTTTNVGRAGVAAASSTRAYVSTDRVKGASDRLIGSRIVPKLLVNRRSSGTITGRLAKVPVGAYFVIVCADAAAKHRELRETNNCRTAATKLTIVAATPPPVVPVPPPVVPVPPPVDPGPNPGPATPVLTSLALSPTVVQLAPRMPSGANADYAPTGVLETAATFAVTAFDALGASMGDVTSSATLSIAPSGSCTGATCGADAGGAHTVTATVGGVTKSTPVSVASLDASYSMTCRGQAYDVNASLADGCESQPSNQGNTAKATAEFRGIYDDCSDGSEFLTTIYSDQRTHANPAVIGFDAPTGSAPRWYRWTVNDAACAIDHEFRIITSGGSPAQDCYEAQVSWARLEGGVGSETVALTGADSALVDGDWYVGGLPPPDNSATVHLQLRKTCATAPNEAVTFDVTFHF
jgi:hypothetical protein